MGRRNNWLASPTRRDIAPLNEGHRGKKLETLFETIEETAAMMDTARPDIMPLMWIRHPLPLLYFPVTGKRYIIIVALYY